MSRVRRRRVKSLCDCHSHSASQEGRLISACVSDALRIQEQVDAADAYDRLLVPGLTGAWAPKVIAAAAIGAGECVLDVACGTGVLGRHAATIVGRAGAVAGVDPGAGMLEVARRHDPSIEWRQGAAE